MKLKTESKQTKALLYAISRGYKVINNVVHRPDGKIVKGTVVPKGYRKFSLRVGKETHPVMVHRLVAYQKFGNEIFKEGIEVRHLNGDKLCNFDYNINIGSHQDNMLDKPENQRVSAAITASLVQKKYDHELIIKDRENGMSLKCIMIKYNISSKGTVVYICKHSHLAKSN